MRFTKRHCGSGLVYYNIHCRKNINLAAVNIVPNQTITAQAWRRGETGYGLSGAVEKRYRLFFAVAAWGCMKIQGVLRKVEESKKPAHRHE